LRLIDEELGLGAEDEEIEKQSEADPYSWMENISCQANSEIFRELVDEVEKEELILSEG